MRQKRIIIILITTIILGGALFLDWNEKSKLKVMGNILGDSTMIDSITAIDGKTKAEIITFSDSDPYFSEMVDVYQVYYELKWTERKLLNDDSFIEIDYFKNGEVKFTISMYQVEAQYISILTNAKIEDGTGLIYSPEGNNNTYVFAIKEINQILVINEGLEELGDLILSEINAG